MPLLFFSNANWILRLYITDEALLIAKKVELINKYDVIEVALDVNSDIFFIYVTTLRSTDSGLSRYLFWTTLLADSQ